MDEGRYRREFLRANSPRYTEMTMGQPARDWMLGILDINRRLRIPDVITLVNKNDPNFFVDIYSLLRRYLGSSLIR